MTKLIFNEKRHTYKYGKIKLTPVTEFIHQYFKPFNQREVARNLNKMKNTQWYKMGIKKILAHWKEQSDEGTRIHREIESYINNDVEGIMKDWHSKSYIGVDVLIQIQKKFNPILIKSEYRIYSLEHKLAGTIDLFMKNENNEVLLIDWKTNNKIQTTAYKGLKGKPPLEHIEDCNFAHYSLQLNIYKYILEECYGFKDVRMMLVHLQDDKAVAYEIVNMRNEVEEMIKYEEKRRSNTFN